MFTIENGSLVIANGLTYIALLMFVAGGLMFLQRTTKWKIFDIVPPLVWIYVLHMIFCTVGLYDLAETKPAYNNFKNKSYAAPQWDNPPTTLVDLVEANKLGIKTGEGFYSYEGVDMEALKAKRDKQLFEIFNVTKKFMADPV